MQNLLMLIRLLIIRRNELQKDISSELDEGRLFELNEIIDLLKDKVDATLKRQPKLNRIVLYLFYYKLYSWEEIMNQFEIDREAIQVIENKFQADFYESESDFET